MNYYIVAGAAIFGIGKSEREAIADYRKQTGDEDGEITHDPRGGKLYVMPCTERLYKHVKQHGGAIAWDHTGTLADIRSEA